MKKAFTLIELLIVIAIILILISIALPNFLEAQTRAKVAKSQGDIKSIATAMEMYYLDWKNYPKDNDSSLDELGNVPFAQRANGYLQLTSPVEYIGSFIQDPFGGNVVIQGGGAKGYRIGSGSWSYPDDGLNPEDNQQSGGVFKKVGKRETYAILGVGPDQARARNAYKCFPYMSTYEGGASTDPGDGTNQPRMWVTYSPTNGSRSIGDIFQFGGGWRSGRFILDGFIIGSWKSPGNPVW